MNEKRKMKLQSELLLNEVGFKLGTLREARARFSDQLAPDFRIFDFLRSDEMGLSRCLANLLDPQGTHGQGSIFLEVFLDKIQMRNDLGGNNRNCRVSVEKQANGSRRLDIFIQFANGDVLGIENKPWANDQEMQLSDYAKYLESVANGKKWLLLFLSNREPSSASISPSEQETLENSKNFKSFDYEELIEWLNICSNNAKAPVVRVFIDELEKFVRTEINGEIAMSDEKEIYSAILSSEKNLESAFQISKAIDGLKKDLLEKLRIDLLVKCEINKLLLIWNISKTKAYEGFAIEFFENQDLYHLGFGFEASSLNEFSWGICRKNKDESDISKWGQVNELMLSKFCSRKSSPHWPWYSDLPDECFEANLKNWSNSYKPWAMIQSGKMAEEIISLSIKVREVFQDKHEILKLDKA
jgi:hypothetical protein